MTRCTSSTADIISGVSNGTVDGTALSTMWRWRQERGAGSNLYEESGVAGSFIHEQRNAAR